MLREGGDADGWTRKQGPEGGSGGKGGGGNNGDAKQQELEGEYAGRLDALNTHALYRPPIFTEYPC